jgi:hypothetical protein
MAASAATSLSVRARRAAIASGGRVPRLTGLGRNAFGATLLLKSQPNDLLDGKALCEGEPLRKGFSFGG